MGNRVCSSSDATLVASVAREVCPFPDYNPNPVYASMMFMNSSLHLRNHYTAVQSSLTPKQLDDFTQGLRTTFGSKGNVTLGGVGVVALSLAVLFDTLARQARGECVPESGLIPGLFIKDVTGDYHPEVYTISKYLRLVPHIANNPKRMIEETERYIQQMIIDDQSTDYIVNDVHLINMVIAMGFRVSLEIHLRRITNVTGGIYPKHRALNMTNNITTTLNCDPWRVEEEFLAKIRHSDKHIQEALENCKPKDQGKAEPWVQHVANLVLADARDFPLYMGWGLTPEKLIGEREDFDLKTNGLGKWPE